MRRTHTLAYNYLMNLLVGETGSLSQYSQTPGLEAVLPKTTTLASLQTRAQGEYYSERDVVLCVN